MDQIRTIVADEDAIDWGKWLSANNDSAAEGFCLIALRRTVGMPDVVIRCWGDAKESDVDFAAIRGHVVTDLMSDLDSKT